MSWKPISLEELEGLGRRIDSELVYADSEGELYFKLNIDYPHPEWAILRAPSWCGDKLVAVVMKPRIN